MGARNEARSNPADKAERQVAAYELVLRGHSLRSASVEMKALGFKDVSHETVRKLVALEAKERVEPLAEEWRTMLIERLNASRLHVMTVLERKHVHISEGRVVRDKDPETGLVGEPIEDDAPVLAAVDRLNRIDAQIAKLAGAEAPLVQEITATVDTRPTEVLKLIEDARRRQEEQESALREQP